MLAMAKYSGEEGLGIRNIRDKINKQRMNILGTEVYKRGKCKKREKYYAGENTGKYLIGVQI